MANTRMDVLVPSFLSYQKNYRHLSESSIRQYKIYLSKFQQFLRYHKKTSSIHVDKITFDDICEFGYRLTEKKAGKQSKYGENGKLQPSTVKSYLSTVRRFFRRCAAHRLRVVDASLIQTPKPQRTMVQHFEDHELLELLSAPSLFECREDIRIRNEILLKIGYYGGLRLQEALNLTFSDIPKVGNQMKIVGKGGQERIVILPDHLIELIRQYNQLRKTTNEVTEHRFYYASGTACTRKIKVNPLGKKSDVLFISQDLVKYGHQLTQDGVTHILRKYQSKMGRKKRPTYHMLRHTFATNLVQRGVELRVVQQMMGHKSILSTQIYCHVPTDMIMEAHKKLSVA